MPKFKNDWEVDIMLNKKEIEGIQEKIKIAEGRLYALKKGETTEAMKASNWIYSPDKQIKVKYLWRNLLHRY